MFLDKSDFISEDHFNYLKIIGVGITPKISVQAFSDILTDISSLSKDRHLIFIVNDVWRDFSNVARKVAMDHELGHFHSGQMDQFTENGEGGAVINEEWEFVADDMSIERNGKEMTLKGLMEMIEILSDNPFYLDNGENLWKNPTIVARLERLGYKE